MYVCFFRLTSVNSSWEANRRSDSQEMSRPLSNRAIITTFTRTRHFTVLRQTNAVCRILPHLYNVLLSIILPYTLRCSEWCLPFLFSDKSCMYFSFSPLLLHVMCPRRLKCSCQYLVNSSHYVLITQLSPNYFFSSSAPWRPNIFLGVVL
jgi:hypothetical protein